MAPAPDRAIVMGRVACPTKFGVSLPQASLPHPEPNRRERGPEQLKCRTYIAH